MMDLLNVDLEQVKKGKVKRSDKVEPLLGLNYRGVLDAATNIPVAGDVLSGGLAIYDAAKGDYGSAALNALGVLPFVSGTFIGKGAKTWDAVKEADALKRIKAGEDRAKVWLETGVGEAPWQKAGTEQALRGEVSDHAAVFDKAHPVSYLSEMSPIGKAKTAEEATRMGEEYNAMLNQVRTFNAADGKVGNAFLHRDLYNAVPDASQLRLEFRNIGQPYGGSYGNGKIEMGMANLGNEEKARSTLLHELQHHVQGNEGFALGGNADAAPLFTKQARDAELSPLWQSNNRYQELSKKAGELSTVNYLKKLEYLSQKENIKPSDITNMSPWYEYSDDIRQWLGPMPKQAGANRDNWLRQAADRMLFREKAKVEMPEYRLNEYLSRDAKDLKNEYTRIDRQRSKHLEGARQYSQLERKFNNIGNMSDFDQYQRLAGEAEARLTQHRMNLTPQERLQQYPYDPAYFKQATGVDINDLIVRGLLDQ